MTLTEWLNQFNNNTSADYSSLLGSGLVSPLTSPDWSFVGNPGDSGDPMGYSLTPDAQNRLSGYSVNPVSNDGNRIGYDVLGQDGANVGGISTKIDKDSWFDKFAFAGGPVALMAAYGLLGPGAAAAESATSAVTPEMIAAANATADPIAALNAAAGWTGVDSAYLASIASAPLLSAPPAGNPFSKALTELIQTSPLLSPVAQAATDGTVQSALNELVSQSMLPPGSFTAPEITSALNELVGSSAIPKLLPEFSLPDAGSKPGSWFKDPIGNVKDLIPALKDVGLGDLAKAGLIGAGLLGGNNAPEAYSGPMPTVSRGGWSPSAAPAAPAAAPTQQWGSLRPGLLGQQGVANSGLWRFLGQ